jgi:hypothetical protein
LPHGELDRLLELVAFLLFGGKIQRPTILPHEELDMLFELAIFLFVWLEDLVACIVALWGA